MPSPSDKKKERLPLTAINKIKGWIKEDLAPILELTMQENVPERIKEHKVFQEPEQESANVIMYLSKRLGKPVHVLLEGTRMTIIPIYLGIAPVYIAEKTAVLVKQQHTTVGFLHEEHVRNGGYLGGDFDLPPIGCACVVVDSLRIDTELEQQKEETKPRRIMV